MSQGFWGFKTKNAFTLAEIIISVMILGIIASVTVPVLINKYHERTTISKVKRTYSQLNQAILMAVANNGNFTYWNVNDGQNATSATQVASYIKPYLNLKKDCGTTACMGYTQQIKFLSDQNNPANYDSSGIYYKMVLLDNINVWLRGYDTYCNSNCFVVFFDINGNEEPNTIGKDIYAIYTFKNGDIHGAAVGDCTLRGKGWSCLNYILENNNMDYLHK